MFKLQLCLVFTLVLHSHCAKILGIIPFPSKSHYLLVNTLLVELAKRGHEVTVISPFDVDSPSENYETIVLDGLLEDIQQSRRVNQFLNLTAKEKLQIMFESIKQIPSIVLEHKNIVKFLNSGRKFDVCIHLHALAESLLGIVHAVNATSIGFSLTGSTNFINYFSGNPSPVYVPNFFLPFNEDMNFMQRTFNTVFTLFFDIFLHWINLPFQEQMYRKYFPNGPDIEELIYNVDLTLVNSHYSTESPRPYVPSLVQIGGFHLYGKEELPIDIKKFLDVSEDGVILFSLGTNAKTSDMSEMFIKTIMDTFSKLPFNFLVKYEDVLDNVPKNVKISQWLPQKAVLSHKNVKAFITHGGFGSTVEAIFNGVPIICIPLFGDQPKNAAESVRQGFAILLEKDEVTVQSLTKAINNLLGNAKYKNNALFRSDLLRNQEINPMEKAVYWVEHVIKHRGAKHLRIKGVDLPWYKYMLLDVIATLVATVFFLTYFTIFILKSVYSLLCRRNIAGVHLKRQ